MLVHANPMIKHPSGIWEDTSLGRVMVKRFLVNWGNHRERWGVYERHRRGGSTQLVSRHITPELAIVMAQRIANRLYRQSKEVKRGKLKSK